MSPVCEADGAVCAEAKAQAAKLRKHGTTRNWNITACKAVSRMCVSCTVSARQVSRGGEGPEAGLKRF
eukprot:scaffold80380_cov60-Phaeocystis_antarctica.AAC.4